MSESDTRYSVTRTGGRTFRVAAARKGGANDLTAALAEAAGDTPEFQAGYQAAQRYLAFGRALRTLRALCSCCACIAGIAFITLRAFKAC